MVMQKKTELQSPPLQLPSWLLWPYPSYTLGWMFHNGIWDYGNFFSVMHQSTVWLWGHQRETSDQQHQNSWPVLFNQSKYIIKIHFKRLKHFNKLILFFRSFTELVLIIFTYPLYFDFGDLDQFRRRDVTSYLLLNRC